MHACTTTGVTQKRVLVSSPGSLSIIKRKGEREFGKF